MENENNVVQEKVTETVATPENETKKNRCPNCQALLDNEQAFCPECGTPLKKTCKKCGSVLADEQAFCPNCGEKYGNVAGADMNMNQNSAINQFNVNLAQQKNKKKNLPIIIGVAVAVVLAIFIALTIGGDKIDFNKQFSDIASESWCTIASDGSYMKLDTNPYDYDDYIVTEAWDKIKDINAQLGFSESVNEKMSQTRSLDGRQEEENDKYKVSWSYHPDNGLEVLYEKK